MKLSNKILIGFFSTILLYTFMVMLEVRLYGKQTLWDGNQVASDVITESQPLNNPAFLDVTGGKGFIRVAQSDQPRVEMQSYTGNLLEQITFEEDEDTLRINTTDFDPDVRYRLSIYVNQKDTLKINADKAILSISELIIKQLEINQMGGRINVTDSSQVANLMLTAADTARFEADASIVERVQINSSNSRVLILTSPKELIGSLTNESLLLTENPLKVQVERDTTSIIRVIE